MADHPRLVDDGCPNVSIGRWFCIATYFLVAVVTGYWFFVGFVMNPMIGMPDELDITFVVGSMLPHFLLSNLCLLVQCRNPAYHIWLLIGFLAASSLQAAMLVMHAFPQLFEALSYCYAVAFTAMVLYALKALWRVD